MACQKSRISQRRTNHVARFQIHSAPVANDHHGRMRSEPAQLPQLSLEPVEEGIGVAQTAHQKAPHYGVTPGRGLDSFLRQQQNARPDFAEMTFFDGRQRR
jgi:hypothetical protein